MRNVIDFSSWHALLSTLLGLAVITLVMVGIRLIVMQTIQQRRERENRQINERLRTLIAAYKTLGGSFTGDLAVDPTHRRDLRRAGETQTEEFVLPAADNPGASALTLSVQDLPGADRRRRVRDAVEAALSDIILLGTDVQVRLAATAASDLVAGRTVETAALVVSLRDFIREVLDLDAVPTDLAIPKQGPLRPSASRGGRDATGRRPERERKAGGGRGAEGGSQTSGLGLASVDGTDSDAR